MGQLARHWSTIFDSCHLAAVIGPQLRSAIAPSDGWRRYFSLPVGRFSGVLASDYARPESSNGTLAPAAQLTDDRDRRPFGLSYATRRIEAKAGYDSRKRGGQSERRLGCRHRLVRSSQVGADGS